MDHTVLGKTLQVLVIRVYKNGEMISKTETKLFTQAQKQVKTGKTNNNQCFLLLTF